MEHRPTVSVLIVDDEPAFHKSVSCLMADMKDEWRIEFARSAATGLDLISKQSFDLVISDLRLPGASGVELLKEVRERCPESGRILYSSYRDQSDALQHAGLVHQFLPKPCPPEWIRGAVERMAMINSVLSDPAIRHAVSKLERVVSLPSLYLKLVRQLQSVETPIEDIAATVSQDIGMTAEVLKHVNSAFFGLPQPTSNVAEAISFLGIDILKYLVLAHGIFSQFENRNLGGLDLEALWRHSAQTAHAAKFIAKYESANHEIIEDALAAGLLHDLGKLVLASQHPDLSKQVSRNARENQVEWFEEERCVFGFDHAEVGGYLLGLWGLPIGVVQAVTFHHAPTKSGDANFAPLTAVHAANVLVQIDGPSHEGVLPAQEDPDYFSKLGRANALERWREALEETQSL